MFWHVVGTDEIFQDNEKKGIVMEYTYLCINIGSVIIPLLASFHPRIRFAKNWSSAFSAIFLAATVFVAWDIVFTHFGIWNFDPDYLIGLYIGNLPFEEVLFFLHSLCLIVYLPLYLQNSCC